MAIHLRFKHQDFQVRAADSVCDVFTGQEKGTSSHEPGYIGSQKVIPNTLTAYGNNELNISEADILANLQAVQRANGLKESESLDGLRFTVEMETGTGKTYTYIRTIHELHRRYGWGKYIVVVPSIAIREGVYKTFQTTEEHFMQDYGERADCFIYDSGNIARIRDFTTNGGICVMIINSQAFSAKTDAARRIRYELDGFGSSRPIDLIAEMRPVVIIDEPQSVEGEQTRKNLEDFRPLFTLRYSATPREYHNMVYRLDAVDAYRQKLVKKICVTGISMSNIPAQGGYVYLKGIIKSDKDPVAVMEFDFRGAKGNRRITRTVSEGMNLYDKSGGLEEYSGGYIVRMIDALNMMVEFLNGIKISPGEISGFADEDQIRRVQIRETIEQHLRKERQLYSLGVKVLSLFFIDRVEKYRLYADDEAMPGVYAKIFEEEYREAVRNFQHEIGGEGYGGYLSSIKPEDTHAGYFSVDKKNHMTDSKPTSKKDDTSDDISAFDLIMRDKERLLGMGEPVRFIFSHSALREGWDNPNVFQICALRNSTSDIRRRQEVGRGLRLCVNQLGERIDSDMLIPGYDVQDINELTVIAGESYSVFAGGLQQEYEEVLGERAENLPISDTHKKKSAVLNREISESPEFLALWQKLSQRQFYSVNFEEGTFIRRCVDEIDTELNISHSLMIVERGEMTAGDSGVTFSRESRRTMMAEAGTGSVKYDLVGMIAGRTDLPRRTVAVILRGIDRAKFAMYRANPEVFITETARIIRGVIVSVSAENISYRTIGTTAPGNFKPSLPIMKPDSMIALTPKRGLYDLTSCDSVVEREFASDADGEETLFAHAKLHGFSIPTPGGRYVPDWAIVMRNGRKLIAETKGTNDTQQLKFSEKAKILCARKFFQSAGIEYKVAESFDSLISALI